MSKFLERARIGRYGAFSNREIGPFEPGLNVVLGPNEAGKSTVASFIGGVLFGWEEARGVRNTYRPETGHREGSLIFQEADDASGDARASVVTRGHNADGLHGDPSITADIDSATFRTMFHLTSEELRSMNNTSDATARLLTAGSGTGSSPAAAFVSIEQKIAAYTSRSGEAPESIFALGALIEEKRERIAEALAQEELLKQEDREKDELSTSRAAAAERIEAINEDLAQLHAAKAQLDAIDAHTQTRREELAALAAERAALAAEHAPDCAIDERLLAIDAAEDRSLRERMDEFSEESAKIARSIDIAKENSSASSAAYEALIEVDDDAKSNQREIANRSSQIIVSILLPIAFIAAGVPVFAHGRDIQSLSFTALGIGMIVLAFFLAAAAIVVLFRPNRNENAEQDKRKDAQWVMLQDRKKLDACLSEKSDLELRICSFLDENGLEGANGSLKQARAMLDDAREARSSLADTRQRDASIEMRESAARDDLDKLSDERRDVLFAAKLDEDASTRQVEAIIEKRSEQREAISRAYEDMNLRFGELSERLEHAQKDRSFNRLKLEYDQALCQMRARKQELVTLMLAKRILEKSIAAWESKSQPDVYAKASSFFSLITGGAWVRVSMTAEGRLLATSMKGEMREVRHLSLGTCQQLYLSLRLAMLEHASDVGCAVPVIADDMLVHFDPDRRLNTAKALARLAKMRQVIVFTCHPETVEALRAADADLNYLEM